MGNDWITKRVYVGVCVGSCLVDRLIDSMMTVLKSFEHWATKNDGV